jgi:hypothetical protein
MNYSGDLEVATIIFKGDSISFDGGETEFTGEERNSVYIQ